MPLSGNLKILLFFFFILGTFFGEIWSIQVNIVLTIIAHIMDGRKWLAYDPVSADC